MASRAVPIPGPMAGPGSPAALADQGVLETTVELETREAMADQGALETMAELETREAEQETWPLFFQVAKVGQGAPWPWLWARPPRQRICAPPKKKILLGKFPSGGHSGGAGAWWRSGGAGS